MQLECWVWLLFIMFNSSYPSTSDRNFQHTTPIFQHHPINTTLSFRNFQLKTTTWQLTTITINPTPTSLCRSRLPTPLHTPSTKTPHGKYLGVVRSTAMGTTVILFMMGPRSCCNTVLQDLVCMDDRQPLPSWVKQLQAQHLEKELLIQL